MLYANDNVFAVPRLVTAFATDSDMLTISDSPIWSGLFVVRTSGACEKVDDSLVHSVSQSYVCNCIEPRAFRLLALKLGLNYDDATYESVLAMFTTNFLDCIESLLEIYE